MTSSVPGFLGAAGNLRGAGSLKGPKSFVGPFFSQNEQNKQNSNNSTSTLFLAKIPPLVVDLQETRGGILATHHPIPFGARLYPIFGRACGAIFFVFLHFRAFQTHFQHFLLLPGTEMCFKTAFLTEMSKIFHISNGKRCHYHCKTVIKGKKRRRPEKIRFWLSFLMQKPVFYSLFLLETTGKTSQNV